MKCIGISGHTSGIGKAALSLLQTRYRIMGFSRENGYDLSQESHIDRMVSIVDKECDIFLNNAFVSKFNASQLTVLQRLLPLWQNHSNKIIVVNSSLSPSYFKHKKDNQQTEYSLAKLDLIEYCESLQWKDLQCRVVNIQFGAVDTPLAQNINMPKISPLRAAEMIELAINNPLIQNLTAKC